MRIKKVATRFLWVVLFALLAACGATPKVDNAAATKIVATFMAQITQTAAAADDLPATVEPTETESPEETETPFVTPTPDAGTLLLGRFRTVTVVKGNLFVRDGTGLPVQITKSGKDHDPVISVDGQKIVFYRGEGFGEVFAVNADGGDEKPIINNKLLPTLKQGDIKYLIFQPNMHRLLFNIYLCNKLTCDVSIFLADADSAKITEVVSGLSSPQNLPLIFAISPNWQYLSILETGSLNIRNLNGKIIHNNILGISSKFGSQQNWLPDSNSLIVVMGKGTDTPDGYMIWRYSLNDNLAEQISFVPQPSIVPVQSSTEAVCLYSISPNRNWLLYNNDQKQPYLGNLKNAESQSYTWQDWTCSITWAPDNQHFASQTAIGSVDGTPPISIDGRFIAWLDATHYLFSKGKNIVDLQSYIAEIGKESAAVPTNFIWSPVYAVLEPGP